MKALLAIKKGQAETVFPSRSSSGGNFFYSGPSNEVVLGLVDPSLLVHFEIFSLDAGTSATLIVEDYSTELLGNNMYEVETLGPFNTPGAHRVVAGPITNKVRIRLVVDGPGSVNAGCYVVAGEYQVSDLAVELGELSGSFSVSGLRNGGKITIVECNDSTWLPLPSVPLSDRNSMGIQNQSSAELYLNFVNTANPDVGWLVKPSSAKFYDLKDTILVYARTKSGSGSGHKVAVEEVS